MDRQTRQSERPSAARSWVVANISLVFHIILQRQ